MSPFEQLVARISSRVGQLPLEAQVALFVCSAEALAESWVKWAEVANVTVERALFDEAVRAARAFSLDGEGVDPELLYAVERETPATHFDTPGFTVAQDCWVCLDTALRASLGTFHAPDSTWYLLEPLFQSASVRILGVSDVGSLGQLEGERDVLTDPALGSGVSSIEVVVDLLSSSSLTAAVLAEARTILAAIQPER